jgi:hypothetical protein
MINRRYPAAASQHSPPRTSRADTDEVTTQQPLTETGRSRPAKTRRNLPAETLYPDNRPTLQMVIICKVPALLASRRSPTICSWLAG